MGKKLQYKTIKKGPKRSSYIVLNMDRVLDSVLGEYPWFTWFLSDQLIVYKSPDLLWRGKIVFSHGDPYHCVDIRHGFKTRKEAVRNTLIRGIPLRKACMRPWETIA